MKKPTCVFVAGGTGGHINAAISMGEAFSEYEAFYLSGTRYLDFQLFKNYPVKHLDSRPLRTKNLIKLAINILLNLKVFIQIFSFYFKKSPEFVVGAGGYICGPTLLAAKILRIPIFIIEQNAVMGLTNKLLSKISDITFTNFTETKGLKTKNFKAFGNPIRANILESKNNVDDNLINVLVFGGSLGANQINDAIKKFIGRKNNFNLSIRHQVGRGNLEKTKTIEFPNIKYQQYEYIDNMNEAYTWSNMIISRAGASTISELRVVKRPSILIPFPAATDNHQYYNAKELQKEKLSHVIVLNHKLDTNNLSNEIEKGIKNIINNKNYFQAETKLDMTSQKIKEEIIKYVRNK